MKSLLTALVLIYLLEPIVCFLTDVWHLPRALALALTYLALFAALGFLLFLLLPDLLTAASGLFRSASDLIEDVSHSPSSSPLPPLLARFPDLISSLLGGLTSALQRLLLSASALLSNLFSSLGSFLIALIMAFYFLLSHRTLGEAIASFLYPLLPSSWSARLSQMFHLLNQSFRSFIASKLLLSLIQGVAIFFSTWAANLLFRLRIPSPLFLGLLTFLANLFPLLGPLLGTAFCGALALLYGLPEGIVTVSLLLLWQQVDNLLLSPRLLSGSSGLSPFWILVVITAAGSLGSVYLLLAAVPLASFAQSVFRAWRAHWSPKDKI